MSNALELLNSLDAELDAQVIIPDEHIVIDENRYLVIPENLKRIAVQFDNEVESVIFDCPRYCNVMTIDGESTMVDMSVFRFYVNYMRADGSIGMNIATDLEIDDTDNTILHFKWTIKNDISFVKGPLKILVCAKCSDENGMEIHRWNSELNGDMYISEGLECEETILAQHPAIITDLLLRMDEVENYVNEHRGYYSLQVSQVDDRHIKVSYIPSSNFMPAIDPVTITLPEGPQGPVGPTGPQGPEGPRGSEGHTPYIGENGNWWINGVDTSVKTYDPPFRRVIRYSVSDPDEVNLTFNMDDDTGFTLSFSEAYIFVGCNRYYGTSDDHVYLYARFADLPSWGPNTTEAAYTRKIEVPVDSAFRHTIFHIKNGTLGLAAVESIELDAARSSEDLFFSELTVFNDYCPTVRDSSSFMIRPKLNSDGKMCMFGLKSHGNAPDKLSVEIWVR